MYERINNSKLNVAPVPLLLRRGPLKSRNRCISASLAGVGAASVHPSVRGGPQRGGEQRSCAAPPQSSATAARRQLLRRRRH